MLQKIDLLYIFIPSYCTQWRPGHPFLKNLKKTSFVCKMHLFSCFEQIFLSKREKCHKFLQFDWLRIYSLFLWKHAKNLYLHRRNEGNRPYFNNGNKYLFCCTHGQPFPKNDVIVKKKFPLVIRKVIAFNMLHEKSFFEEQETCHKCKWQNTPYGK